MKINFNPISTEFEFAASEYRDIWLQYGEKIVSIWQNLSGLIFNDSEIDAIIFEGISQSHPLKLRASYSYDVKKSVLVHELGHRLLGGLGNDTNSLEVHKTLFLILYDVFENLFGIDFTMQAVEWERNNLPKEIYREAWDWAISFSKEERIEKFKDRIKS